MHSVHLDIVFAQDGIRMARLASGRLQTGVTMISSRHCHLLRCDMALSTIGWLSMQLMVRVAIHAIHASIAEVHITRDAFVFAQVFIPHPAAMASRARTSHGRFAYKFMAFKKTTTHIGGLGYMTTPTRCMAASAVIAKHLFECGMVFRGAASI
jgi:hypothetical protein